MSVQKIELNASTYYNVDSKTFNLKCKILLAYRSSTSSYAKKKVVPVTYHSNI